MKFGNTARLILAIGIFAIAIFMLYQNVLEQELEQAELGTQIALAQGTLPKLVTEEEELNSQLSQLENDLSETKSQLNESKASFPRSTESIEYDRILFRLAHESDLDIVKLTASEPRDQKVETELNDEQSEIVTYTITSFMVEVRGKPLTDPPKTEDEHKAYIDQTVANILDFVSAIATGDDFTTATVEQVNVSISEPITDTEPDETDEEEMEKEAEIPSATITFVIYSYKGE